MQICFELPHADYSGKHLLTVDYGRCVASDGDGDAPKDAADPVEGEEEMEDVSDSYVKTT